MKMKLKELLRMEVKFTRLRQPLIQNKSQYPKGKCPQMPQVILGPPRVKPGRLSVSRTFGDIEAKYPAYGGNPKVVIAVPEISKFTISPNFDFLILG
jgi:serine/threonine protein phosphatase PrpC